MCMLGGADLGRRAQLVLAAAAFSTGGEDDSHRSIATHPNKGLIFALSDFV